LKVPEPKNIRPYDQRQNLLFPPNLHDFIKDNDLCQVINDVVDSLDLSCLYRNVSGEGRKPYHPKMMLKVLFYAYANRTFSSRAIAKALGENVAFIYLAGWQRPDFRTINSFRKNNAQALSDLFAQIVVLCRELNMVKLGHISIDGSKFKANAADGNSYDQQRIEKQIRNILDQADQIDRDEDELYGPDKTGDEIPDEIADSKKRIEKLKEIQRRLKNQGRKKVNATDPDAAFMKTRSGIKTCYNAQACVDEDSQVIVAAGVTDQPNDDQQLIPMIDQAEANTGGEPGIVTADSGYGNASNLKKLESYELDAYIPDDTYQSRRRGKPVSAFDKDNFVYDPQKDVFICPEGCVLTFWYCKGDYRIYRYAQCKQCVHFGQCTKSNRGRSIWRRDVDDRIKAMRAKLDSEAGKAIYAKRKHIVEPVFGQIKASMGFTGFLLRGLAKVNLEFTLVAIAHNLRKITRYCYQKDVGIMPKQPVAVSG
jgi:transposase